MNNKLQFSGLEKTLLPWITLNSKAFTNHILKKLKENGIDSSREQMIILGHLSEKDGQVQNDLAFVTNRDKTSLTRIVNNMQKKGLLERVQCEEDNRCNKIFISKEGRQLFNKGFPIVHQIVKKIQKNISEEEIASSVKVLKQVFQNLIELENEEK